MSLEKKEIIKLSPFDGQEIYRWPKTTVTELIKIIQSSNKSFLDWKQTPLSLRIKILEQIISEYVNLKNEIISSESLDQGLNFNFTEKANFQIGFQLLNQLLAELNHYNNSSDNSKIYSPNGVVVVILSWNLSNRIFIQKVISALMAGNTIIVKCSSVSLSTAKNWLSIFSKVGLNDHIIEFVFSDDQDFKKILISHPGVKAVTISGRLETSVSVYKAIAQLSQQQFKKIQLHSGSKNSCISLDQPNESLAKSIIEMFLIGQGQLSWNSSRLFILEKHFSSWIDLIQAILNALTPATGIYDESTWGPLIKASSFENYETFEKMALKDQAKFVSSKHSFNSMFQRKPKFTYDMSNCSELQQDQIHTPIFILSQVKYGFDIPKYLNVSYFGQTTEFFSTSVQEKIIQQLDVGSISMNKWSIYEPNDLFKNSVKQSSFGDQSSRIFGGFNSNVKILT